LAMDFKELHGFAATLCRIAGRISMKWAARVNC
jgi:hypothetical protein